MNSRIVRVNGLVAAIVASLLAACSGGSGIEGEYVGAERYEATTDEGRIQLELMAGGMARLTMLPFGGGRDMPQRASFDLSYQVRGGNVMIEMPGEGPTELTRSGRDLLMIVDGEMARFVRQ